MDARNQRIRVRRPLPGRFVALLMLAVGMPAIAEVRHLPDETARLAQQAFERGRIHEQQGHFDVAEESYRTSIAVVEESGGAYAPILIDYLSRLGNLYVHMGRYDQAIDQFQHAQHIIHRHHGVYSPEQLAVVEAMTRTYLQTRQMSKADRQQRLFYQVVAKQYPPDDGRLVPAVEKLGKWMITTGQIQDGIDRYEQLLQLGDSLGDDSSRLEALQMLTIAEFLGSRCCPERRLEYALRLVGENPDKDWGDEAQLLMQLGDLYVATDRGDDASKFYRQAHALLPATDTRGSAKQGSMPELLSLVRPRRLVAAIHNAMTGPRYRPAAMETYYMPAPAPTVAVPDPRPGLQVVGTPLPLCARVVAELADRSTIENGEPTVIDMDFTVNKHGKVSNVKVLGGNGSRRLSEYAAAVLRAARFRPRLIGGEAATVRHVRLTEVIDASRPAELGGATVDPFRVSAMAACGSWERVLAAAMR